MKPHLNKALIFVGVPVLLVLLLGGYTALFAVSKQGWMEKKVLIPEGATLEKVSQVLEEEGVISHPWFFVLAGKATLSERRIHAGEYLLNSEMGDLEMLRIFRDGKILTHRLVVREGATLREVGHLLADEGLVDGPLFDALTHDTTLLSSMGISGESLEGYLYPDTYFFYKGQKAESILRRMVSRFHEMYIPQFTERAQEIGMNQLEVVTLASIIEKEAVAPSDSPLISAVFHNRLRKGIPLQSDPTVIYALGEGFDGDLKRVHLRIASPYNTYVHKGLPPGPIGSPSRASLRAALYPSNEDYYYFVSKNDGTHFFSKTIKDHNMAVAIYQRRS
jgi:UPF0755 protein